MADYPILPKAPLTEALIDIRIQPKENFDLETFLSLHKEIADEYPDKKERIKWEGSLSFQKDQDFVRSESQRKVLGYLFGSADGKEIFQARTDGFTFNRLEPYERWEIFREKALKLWKLYSKVVKPNVFRVALRYINKLNIPFSPANPFDFNDFLVGAPIVPAGLPQAVNSFLTRVVIQDNETELVANISQLTLVPLDKHLR